MRPTSARWRATLRRQIAANEKGRRRAVAPLDVSRSPTPSPGRGPVWNSFPLGSSAFGMMGGQRKNSERALFQNLERSGERSEVFHRRGPLSAERSYLIRECDRWTFPGETSESASCKNCSRSGVGRCRGTLAVARFRPGPSARAGDDLLHSQFLVLGTAARSARISVRVPIAIRLCAGLSRVVVRRGISR